VAIVLMQGFSNFMSLLSLALILFCAFTFFDSLFRREDAFRAADKKTKPFWAVILGLALVVSLLMPILSFLPIIGLIAAIVYTVDVRPALQQVTGGGRRRGGSSSDGPYGPYNGGR
jgi:amino acid transporter